MGRPFIRSERGSLDLLARLRSDYGSLKRAWRKMGLSEAGVSYEDLWRYFQVGVRPEVAARIMERLVPGKEGKSHQAPEQKRKSPTLEVINGTSGL